MFDQGRETLDVRIIRSALLFLMRVLFRIEHSGMENVPAQGPVLFVANHVTYIDPFWIAVRVYRTLRFMAWDKIFELPVAGAIFRWLGAFPVSLENPESSAFKAALTVLRQGHTLMIFPEGGRSADGRLMPFKPGAAKIAARTGAAIVPVVIHGGAAVWNRHMWVPRPRKVRVEYLKPILPSEFDETAQELTARLKKLIGERLGQKVEVPESAA
jgi:1-acyl-sn-glycerol-3-phosphate acyltransferase